MYSSFAIRVVTVVFALLPAAVLPIKAAEQDALSIDSVIQARHLPYGTILDPVLSLPDLSTVQDYSRCGDSALWTGHYLAAEAYRYAVTGSADAMTNVNNAIQGIKMLLDVTGNNALARCAVPADSPFAASIASQEAANGIYQGAAWGAPYIWVGNTSRDEYIGVFYGIEVTYELITNQGVRNWCSYLTTRMLDYLESNWWNVILPDGTITTSFLIRPDQQLALLLVAKSMNGPGFASKYSDESNLISPGVPVAVGVDCVDHYDSYYKFNLDYINFFTLMRLGSGYSKLWYDAAYSELKATTGGDQNAHFNMIDRAINGPNSGRDAQTAALLDAWLLRPRVDVYRDFSSQFPNCGNGNACSPLPVEDRVTTDFLWQRSPVQLAGGGDGDIETAGIDYILPYWMARYYGVITQ
ncbi:MAG TPA: hypothetical protein VGG72_27610 [Bryobacteraceae bacterium]|jgi:hypothetical protein